MSADDSIRESFDRVAASAERVGYAQAFVDILTELERVGKPEAVLIVARFGYTKGVGAASAPASTEAA